jgi:hypothetical protein
MVFAQALDASGWTKLMEEAGLLDVFGNAQQMDIKSEIRGRFERYGRWSMVKAMPRMLALFLRDRRTRRFVRDGAGAMSKNLLEVMGYGVYAGRKA